MKNDSEYVDLLVQIVHGATTAAGQTHITAAALGETLRRAASDQSWKSFGYKTLGELLRSPKAEARLELFKTDKGALAVRPRKEVTQSSTTQKEYNRLKKPVWGAFVMATPAGKRFLNRRTGAVRSGLQTPPAPYDEWAEIAPVSGDTQKVWARDFLATAAFTATAEMHAALNQPGWNHAFSVALGPNASDWNRLRSSKVASLVDEWASSSGIPHDLVFQTKAVLPDALSSTGPVIDPLDDRSIILAALATLPIERLREIPIPASALLGVLRNN